jgi:hypothetical protein
VKRIERLLRAVDRFQQRLRAGQQPGPAAAGDRRPDRPVPRPRQADHGSVTTIQGSGIGLVVGIVGTLWGGLGITQSAQDAMNAVWNVPRKDRPDYWFRLARGLGSLLLVVMAVFAATVLAQLGRIGTGIGRPNHLTTPRQSSITRSR